MENENKYKIFQLMCTDTYKLAIVLFKANNLDFDEFIDWVLNKGEWIDHDYSGYIPHIFYYKYIDVLGFRIAYICGHRFGIYINSHLVLNTDCNRQWTEELKDKTIQKIKNQLIIELNR